MCTETETNYGMPCYSGGVDPLCWCEECATEVLREARAAEHLAASKGCLPGYAGPMRWLIRHRLLTNALLNDEVRALTEEVEYLYGRLELGALTPNAEYPSAEATPDEQHVSVIIPAGWSCSVMATNSNTSVKPEPQHNLKDRDYSSFLLARTREENHEG